MNAFFDLDLYIEKFTNKYSSINSIWLIGSRANNIIDENSDWDLIVFGDKTLLEELKSDVQFNLKNVDLLVVYDGTNFQSPWTEADESKKLKKGNLTEWSWKVISPFEAQHKSNIGLQKSKEYIDGTLEKYGTKLYFYTPEEKLNKAVKIWPKNNGGWDQIYS